MYRFLIESNPDLGLFFGWIRKPGDHTPDLESGVWEATYILHLHVHCRDQRQAKRRPTLSLKISSLKHFITV